MDIRESVLGHIRCKELNRKYKYKLYHRYFMKFYNFDVAIPPIRVLVKYINSRVNE